MIRHEMMEHELHKKEDRIRCEEWEREDRIRHEMMEHELRIAKMFSDMLQKPNNVQHPQQLPYNQNTAMVVVMIVAAYD